MTGMYVIWCLLGAATILNFCRPIFHHRSTAFSAEFSIFIGLFWVAMVTVLAQGLASGVLRGEPWQFDGWQIANTLAVAPLLAA
jgi:two-component system sensor histidine kinase AlgZ